MEGELAASEAELGEAKTELSQVQTQLEQLEAGEATTQATSSTYLYAAIALVAGLGIGGVIVYIVKKK